MPSRSACWRRSGPVSISTPRPFTLRYAEQRVRRFFGSGEEQVGQSQPMAGVPELEPQPSMVRSTV